MNNMNTSCVVRTTDVMEDYISQMDPDGEYLEHAFNFGNARNWAERQGHKYSDRVWNAAKGGWNYIYNNASSAGNGARSFMNRQVKGAQAIGKLARLNRVNSRVGTTGSKAMRRARYRQETQLKADFRNSLFGKASRALKNAKARIQSVGNSAYNSKLGKDIRSKWNTRNSNGSAPVNKVPGMIGATSPYNVMKNPLVGKVPSENFVPKLSKEQKRRMKATGDHYQLRGKYR